MGITKELRKYGKDHPVVTLALAGTFGYYFYQTMIVPRKSEGTNWWSNPAGLGMTTSTSTTSSSSHIPDMMREDAGETSMPIAPTAMYGLQNKSFITKVNRISGMSASARRRIGHSVTSSSIGYSPTLDTQISNNRAMLAGDLKKHQDILGFSGLVAPSGGDWYE